MVSLVSKWLIVVTLMFPSVVLQYAVDAFVSNGSWMTRGHHRATKLPMNIPKHFHSAAVSNKGKQTASEKEFPINRDIEADQVRLMLPILESGEEDLANTVLGPMIETIKKAEGVVSFESALSIANCLKLDLVLINNKGVPPLCKIVNVGKYKYAMEKKRKEHEKKQTTQEIKEIKLTCGISQHDIDFRIRAAKEHLESGDKVRFVSNFMLSAH